MTCGALPAVHYPARNPAFSSMYGLTARFLFLLSRKGLAFLQKAHTSDQQHIINN